MNTLDAGCAGTVPFGPKAAMAAWPRPVRPIMASAFCLCYPAPMTSSALAPHREMWRRVRQNIDVTYESLLLLDDVALLEAWRDLIATDWRKDRDWYRQ